MVIMHGLKYLNLSGNWPWSHDKINFSSKDKNFGTIGKIIWFWSIFNKEPWWIMTSLGDTGCQSSIN